MTPYFELKRIAAELTENFDCALFGSLGLELTYPEVLDNPPGDADLVAADEQENLKGIIQLLQANGYTVYSWEEPIVKGFNMEILTGRLYIRGIKHIPEHKPAIIDVTYELKGIEIRDLLRMTKIKEGIRVLNIDGYIMALEICEKAKHLQERELLIKKRNTMQEKQKKEQTLLFGMKNKLTFATQNRKRGCKLRK